MDKQSILYLFLIFIITFHASGCSRGVVGGAALGAAGAGAAYEYQNKKQLDQLENDFEAGRIDKQEYQKRKKDIQSGSLIY